MSQPPRRDDARDPDRERPDGVTPERDAPESEAPEEALLLSEWAAGLDAADDIPEEVLALLEGSLDESEAARVRRRLAADPVLARAAGELVSDGREVSEPLGREVPGRLLREATDLVPPSGARNARPGFLARLLEWTRIPAAPGLAAAAAVVLLIGFVFVERGRVPAPLPEPVLRSAPVAPEAIVLTSPPAGARVTGDLEMRWEEVPGAVRYRVVLVSADDGEVADAGHTGETRLIAPGANIARQFGEEEPHALHWIVRAHLLDGTELSSEPRRVTWSSR